jgi:hypothetical protein
MKATAAIANWAWLASCTPAWMRFLHALKRPGGTQQGILQRLLRDNAATAYGRAHDFADIRSCEAFRDRVPIVDYDALEPWIGRIMRGEESVLTREKVTRLVPTAGSTGARKLIPFTLSLQREFNAAIGPWMADLCRADPSVPLGPAYWSISPSMQPVGCEDSAVPIGFDDDSAYLGGVRRRLVEATFAAPSALRSITDPEAFRYATLLCLLRQPDLRLVSVWHPSFLTLLLDALPAWWKELLEDVASGDCRRAPAEVRHALRGPPQPHRLQALHQANPADAHSLFPQLRVVSCWGDAQAALPMADLQRRLPKVTMQAKGLLATEAFVSIPFQQFHPLAVTSHFFEFADERGAVRLAHELRRGELYNLVVTTAGGLWRYRLGDIVEVDGFVAETPSLRFLGRGSSASDLCGEKLTEVFVTRAIATACSACGYAPAFAMLAPERDAVGRWNYTLFLGDDAPASLLPALEAELRSNPHYALCRDLGQLGPLRRFISTGANDDFIFKDGVSQGRLPGGIKPQSLSTRTDWRECFAGAGGNGGHSR